jgi:CHAT domain-containing protein
VRCWETRWWPPRSSTASCTTATSSPSGARATGCARSGALGSSKTQLQPRWGPPPPDSTEGTLLVCRDEDGDEPCSVRYALTACSLSSCSRELACIVGGVQAVELLEEAERSLRSALLKLNLTSSVTLPAHVSVLNNLGNVLRTRGRELGDADSSASANEVFQQAVTMVQELEGLGSLSEEDSINAMRVRLNLCGALLTGERASRDEVFALTEPVIAHHKDTEWGLRAWLCRAHALVNQGTAQEAWALIQGRVSYMKLTVPEDRISLANLASASGHELEELVMLRSWIHQAFQERRRLINDAESDHALVEPQMYAARGARLHAGSGEFVEAFLLLEETAALRFEEQIFTQARSPTTPQGRYLEQEAIRVSVNARLAAGFAMMLEMDSDVPVELLDRSLDMVRERLASQSPLQEDALHHIRELSLRPNPAQELRGFAQEQGQRMKRIRGLLQRNEQWVLPDGPVGPDELQRLLRENEDTVFLRISLAADLLAVAVWWDGERVQGQGVQLQMPDELLAWLGESARAPEPTRGYALLNEAMAGLDLSVTLPSESVHPNRVVVLPSALAALLPLAAVGPEGCTLLDRFEAVTLLPCLAPLRVRPAPHAPRAGQASFAPDTTLLGRVVYQPELSGEVVHLGEAASLQRFLENLSRVEVLSLYTHGHHEYGEPPHLQLHDDERLGAEGLDDRWRGLERVELWACSSGVHQPHDWLTPQLLDEHFGLDMLMVAHGARSAIGTQRPVLEWVTAALMTTYRKRLREGVRADRALCDALRWWRDEALPRLEELMRALPIGEAVARFAQQYDVPLSASGMGWLGPAASVEDEPMDSQELDRLLEMLGCPVSWASYRFTGVCERRPVAEWSDEPMPELSSEEREELERWLTGDIETFIPREALEDALNERLAQASAPPTPTQALSIAEAYRERQYGSHHNNLLVALAWLHEALVGASGPDADTLRVAAARLWIELAIDEVFLVPAVVLNMRCRVYLARASRLLEALHEPELGLVERAWVNLKFDKSREADLEAMIQRAVACWGGQLPSRGGLDGLVLACRLLSLAPAAVGGLAQQVLDAIGDIPSTRDMVVFARRSRALWARELLLARLEGRPAKAMEFVAFLTPNELSEHAIQEQYAITSKFGWSSVGACDEHLSQSLVQYEIGLWGGFEAEADDRWRTWGRPSTCYMEQSIRLLAVCYGVLHAPEEALRALASLHLGADLRVSLFNQWMRRWGMLNRMMPGRETHKLLRLYEDAWLRARAGETSLELLRAQATHLSPTLPPTATPHRLDPFCMGRSALQGGFKGPEDMVAFSLGEASTWSLEERPYSPRTVAFAIARNAEDFRQTNELMWEQHLAMLRAEKAPEAIQQVLSHFGDLSMDIDEQVRSLSRLPEGHAILTAGMNHKQQLFACLVSSHGNRAVAVDEPGFITAYVELLAPTVSDCGPTRGRMGRQSAWGRVSAALSRLVSQCMDEELLSKLQHLYIFMPGLLRPLPWLMVQVYGAPLCEHFASVIHMPSLAWRPTQPPEQQSACLHPVLSTEDGESRFGARVIQTIRSLSPPDHVIERGRDTSRDIVEVTQLQAVQTQLSSLRIYGVGGWYAMSETVCGVQLEGKRHLSEATLWKLALPNCNTVEIWAATSVQSIDYPLPSCPDRIPGLARTFLMSGARGVLDLCWPVHDLVKALVCERYTVLRLRFPEYAAPMALAEAIDWCRDVLKQWRKEPKSTIAEALQMLDVRRAFFGR